MHGDPLEGIEDHLIAALALVRREIALEHAALRPQSLDAGLDVGPPGGGQLFRGRRSRTFMKIIAEQSHRKPTELHHDVGAFRGFPYRGLPCGEDFVSAVGIAADADHPAAMVKADSRIREGAGKVNEIAKLRMEQPGIETQTERRKPGK